MFFPKRGFVDSIPNDGFDEKLHGYQPYSHSFQKRGYLWVLAMDCLGTGNCSVGHDEGEGSRGCDALFAGVFMDPAISLR
jgi:hypothetical protein